METVPSRNGWGTGWGGRRGEGTQGPHLVQQNDVWSLENGASDGDTLLLPTAQLQSSLTHLRIVPCGNCPPPSSHSNKLVFCDQMGKEEVEPRSEGVTGLNWAGGGLCRGGSPSAKAIMVSWMPAA